MSVSIIFNNYILFFDDNCVQNAQNADAAKPWKIYPKDVTFLVLEKKGKRKKVGVVAPVLSGICHLLISVDMCGCCNAGATSLSPFSFWLRSAKDFYTLEPFGLHTTLICDLSNGQLEIV